MRELHALVPSSDFAFHRFIGKFACAHMAREVQWLFYALFAALFCCQKPPNLFRAATANDESSC